jgi:hypothetical protein
MIATICRVVWAPRLVVFVAGVVFGAFSLAVARGEPGYPFGGSSTFASAAELIAGCALLAVGLIASARPREARLGTILVAASIAWFVLEWNNPGASSAPVFPRALVRIAGLSGWEPGQQQTWQRQCLCPSVRTSPRAVDLDRRPRIDGHAASSHRAGMGEPQVTPTTDTNGLGTLPSSDRHFQRSAQASDHAGHLGRACTRGSPELIASLPVTQA